MKATLDDKQVPARCWYYLLDFNDTTDKKFILEIEPDCQGRLSLLTYEQFWKLFKVATDFEITRDWNSL